MESILPDRNHHDGCIDEPWFKLLVSVNFFKNRQAWMTPTLAGLFCPLLLMYGYFLISNFFFPTAQGTSNIAVALAVIADFLLDFTCSIATRALHFSETLTLVTLFRHDVITPCICLFL
jgi:hypothetical protein